MSFLARVIACVVLAVPALAQTGMTNMTASHIRSDISGQLLTGKLCLTPVIGTVPTGFTDGTGAQNLPAQVCYTVINGVLNISVPDTSLTTPEIGYKVVAESASGVPLYGYSQPIFPAGTPWSFDTWAPWHTSKVTSPTVSYSTSTPIGDCGSAVAINYSGTIQTGISIYTCVQHSWQLVSSNSVSAPTSVLNVVPPSGDTTGATDVARITASCTGHNNAQLLSGNYYINAAINMTVPCRILGAGSTTVINNKGLTNDWFRISYYTAWPLSPWVYPPSTDQSEIAYMQFAQVGKPTAGYVFNIGSGLSPSGGTYPYTMNVHVHDTVANNAWGGAYLGNHELYTFIDHNMWRNFVGGGAIFYDAAIGSGDNHIDNNEFSGLQFSGIIITQSDTQMFSNDKLNGSGIKFTGVSATQTVQFNDLSIETGITQPCAIDFGTGFPPANIQFNGGESIGFSTLICHPENVNGLAFNIANSGVTSDYPAGLVTNNGWRPLPTIAQTNGLANASAPTFTPVAGSYLSAQSVAIACATGTPYYQAGSGAVTQYTTAISVSASETINAGCYGTGLNTTTIAAAYAIGAPIQDQATFVGTSGTPLSAYTTSAGKTFALYSGDGISPVMPQLGGSGTVVLPTGNDSTFGDSLDTLAPSSANYTVSATYFVATGNPVVGVYARADSASNTNYIAQFSSGILQLYSQHGGSTVTLGTTGFSWPSGQTHTISVTANGSTISASIDGTTNLGPFTDAGVTAAGQGGFRITGGSNAILTNFFIQ